jgi:hypothetical protein
MRVLRNWVVLGLVVGVSAPAVTAASVSAQQPTIELKPRFNVTIGASVRKGDARRAALSGRIRQVQPSGPEPAQIAGGSLWLPRGLAFDPGKAAVCRRSFFVPDIEPCPDDSILGKPSWARAFDAVAAEVDDFTEADYVFVNGGAGRIWAFMTIYNPALVQEPVPVDVRALRGKRWSYRLDFKLPKVLMIIGGIPTNLRSFDVELDGVEQAPGYLTLNRRCPKRGHFAYRASLTFLHNDGTTSEASRRARLRCRGVRG